MAKTAIPPTLCNRCGHVMWQDEKGKWHCTNPKCRKYKEPPVEPETDNDGE